MALFACVISAACAAPAALANSVPLRAGAAVVDVSPRVFPVEVNGSFLSRSLDHATGPLAARAVVFERAGEFAAIVVVDSCMVPRDVCDAIKQRAAAATGIPMERMLVAATHTHSAPSLMDHCLGAMRDETYTAQFIPEVAEAIALAHARLEPALVGAAAVDAWDLTFCRRWIKRSDRIATDPFGLASVRAMMHPSPLEDSVGPAGPVDPALTILSVVRPDGRPVAVLANFSMHYLGAKGVSPDYFGPFADAVERGLEAEHPSSGCVAVMSQGTSGDLHRISYDADNPTPDCVYHEELARRTLEARRGIAHVADAPLAMAQAELTLERRTPDAGRLAWARRFEEARGDRRPLNKEEVYAMQAAWLHEHPRATLVLQALRVGDLAITALPNEVYGITGLKLKRHSPLPLTMNVELANGAEGYIPPPEQHVLGGYTTWPASTAGLEVAAEPRIVETVVGLLERVTGRPRRPLDEAHGPAARAVLDLGPHAYWRLEEMNPPLARDAAGARHAAYEDGVAFHLPGVGGDPARDMATAAPLLPNPFSGPRMSRAAHCAGGRVRGMLPSLPRESYSVSLWIWNGYPVAERPVTGFFLSRGGAGASGGDHLGIGGTDEGRAGRLIVTDGERTIAGSGVLALRRWHHVVFVRDSARVRVYLDGAAEPDLEADLPSRLSGAGEVFVGGRTDGGVGFEGKVDEVAVFDRPLSAAEVGRMYAATGRPVAAPPPASAETPPEADQPAVSDQPALGPEEARAAVFVPPGFALELAAAEPQVLDPVAFDWDSAGRLWVVEMADYPLGMDGKGRSGGRIRVLEDADADGRYEQATLFADGLNFPNGCLTWRDGVIVTAAPEILFLSDTDGDGRADRREVLVRGLAEGNQQLRPNGLRWGLDNWVYVASGSPGGAFTSTLVSTRGGTELAVGSRDFRFRPDTGELEAESGPTQFGRNRDDWGRWFGTQNAKPLWHYVLAARYTARNPFVAPGTLTQPVLPADVAVHPAQPPEKRYHNFQQAGHYTSACGGMIHRDPRLCGADETAAFVCEPFHNLVQRARLRDAGVSFAGEPVVVDGRDFLTSTDRWFRPVMIRTGPDGALWVADMYRFMIEHPDWLPPEGKDELLPRYRHGDDRGRIYRITASGAPRPRVPDLRPLDGPGLVGMLESENGFLRDKAHQMLLWRGGEEAVATLRGLARDPSRPLGCLHALCVLDGLGRLEPADVRPALGAAHPGLRENALRLAEPWLAAEAGDRELAAAVVAATGDGDARVRFQAALACGASGSAEAGAALGRLLVTRGREPFMEAAIMTASPRHVAALATAAAAAPEALDRVLAPLVQVALGTQSSPALATLLSTVGGGAGEAAATARLGLLLDGLVAAKTSLERIAEEAEDAVVRREARRVAALLDATVGLAEREHAPAAERLAAARVALSSAAHRDRAVGVLAALLSPLQPPDVQQGVVRALAVSGATDAVPDLLADFWPQCSPSVRPAVIDAWLGRRAWCLDLLGRIERGEVKASALDASARARLTGHTSNEVARLARRALGTATGGRAGVIERYRPALEMAGDNARGLAVYRRVCASCHRHGDEGREIGPDLRTFAGHAPEKLLANIFDPSSDIQPGYQAFVCTLDSGEQLYGIVTGETDAGIRFKCADASEKTILRGRIESLTATNVSFMPEGLEATLAPGDVADLIAFLRQPAAGSP